MNASANDSHVLIAGGGIGGFGAQHSQSTEALLLHTPGLQERLRAEPALIEPFVEEAIRRCSRVGTFGRDGNHQAGIVGVRHPRAVGVGEIHHWAAFVSVLRCDWRRDADRRARFARCHAGIAA